MGAVNWTKEQLAVINSVDTDTLVSASAGSGKTAVMLERVMRLVTGQNGKGKTPLKRIIMVTFNESVASELRSKISSRLAKELAFSDDKDYLRKQIEDVPISDISTLHSLCSTIIKNNFEYLGIEPSFSIVDDSEKQVLFGKAISNVMKQYRESYDYQIDILINYLGGENRFLTTLSNLYGFLEAQLDRQDYLDRVAFACYDGQFKDSGLTKQYLASMHAKCIDLYNRGEQLSRDFCYWGMSKRQDHIAVTLEYLAKLTSTATFEEFGEAVRLAPEFARIPSSKKDDFDRQVGAEYKAYNDEVKRFVNEELKGVFSASIEQMQESIDKNKEYLVRLVDILKSVCNEYSELKRKDNKMDFADLEYFAVKVMQNDDIASELSSDYDYICVDEYQDINAVQEYILTRLSNGKNLFMVGDVKQSIYQFRMTDPKIFLSKYRLFKQKPQLGKSFSLNSNYRSCREVIDFVNAIFDVIMREDMGGIDYKKESRLAQGNLDYDLQEDKPIRIAHFSKSAAELSVPMTQGAVYSVRDDAQDGLEIDCQEGKYIARQIKELVGKRQIQVSSPEGGMTYRPIRYSDIALLCSKRSESVENIINQLKQEGIPVDGSKVLKEKNNNCVSLFLSFVRVLDNYRQDIPLVEILTSNVFANFSYGDMAKIKMTYRSKDFFHEAVDTYAKEQSDDLATELQRFFELLNKYRNMASFMSVDELLRAVIEDFNYREYVTSIDGGLGEFVGLESFLQSLDGKPYNVGITKFVEAMDETADFSKVSGEAGFEGDCVITNTIHKSKGLEYPIVFIIDAGRQLNLSDLLSSNIICDKDYGIAIKNIDEDDRFYEDSLPIRLMREVKTKDVVEEYMRLFYVAVTRARNKLYITATGGLSGKSLGEKTVAKPKSMLAWINNAAIEDKGFLAKYYDEDIVPYDGGLAQRQEEIAKRKLVDIYSMDAICSQLKSNYAFAEATSLPVKYTVTKVNNDYYDSLYSDSSERDGGEAVDAYKDGDYSDDDEIAKRASADEGVAYHRTLECIDYDCYTVDDVVDRLDGMVEQGLLSAEQRTLVNPESILECLQSEIMDQARKYPHYREKQFMLNIPAKEFLDVECDDKVLLQGTVDLFIKGDDKGGENILVDFKFSKKSPAEVKKRYTRQLELYAMAIEECMGVKVDKKVIFMLGKNKVVTV